MTIANLLKLISSASKVFVCVQIINEPTYLQIQKTTLREYLNSIEDRTQEIEAFLSNENELFVVSKEL